MEYTKGYISYSNVDQTDLCLNPSILLITNDLQKKKCSQAPSSMLYFEDKHDSKLVTLLTVAVLPTGMCPLSKVSSLAPMHVLHLTSLHFN
jgi:hypothetical protein